MEEGVLFDCCISFHLRAQTLRGIFDEEALDQGHRLSGLRISRKVFWERERRVQDFLEDLRLAGDLATVGERKLTKHKLVQADAQTPEVSDGGVARVADHLRCHKHGCPSPPEALAFDPQSDAKIDQFQVALKAIFTLQVQIGDAASMKELESQNDGASVELSLAAV
eukprot:CAMPEP_0115670766 /NCGR_PEP_ID=MMETSP0272-20121206/51707_1 /TAXON_ID=71861 /ORGANISM="Scrippsiella trochoidea, Strain CCMP3099" /LENGTH=166 /DNA_ID=CAMNT_0003109519 /DNA_START=108 /DNA_END=612 /DNA_ORIENTATION=+